MTTERRKTFQAVLRGIAELRAMEPPGSHNERILHAAYVLLSSYTKDHGSGAWRKGIGTAASVCVSLLSGARMNDPYERWSNQDDRD